MTRADRTAAFAVADSERRLAELDRFADGRRAAAALAGEQAVDELEREVHEWKASTAPQKTGPDVAWFVSRVFIGAVLPPESSSPSPPSRPDTPHPF